MLEIVKALPAKRLKDYALNATSHLTFQKFLNIIHTEINIILRKEYISSYPYMLTVDPTNICQLRCPLCSTGQRKNLRDYGKMSFSIFKKIIDEIGGYLLNIHLLWWGEPFLNKDILKFVKYAHQNNIGTFISTNFSHHLSDDYIREVVKSGLDVISISLDGVTSEVYSKYRVGGDFNLVVKNIKTLVKFRKELKSKTPRIEWQFLVNKYNEHQLSKLDNFASNLGVDSVILEQLLILFGQSNYQGMDIKKWLPKNKKYQPTRLSLKNNKSDNLVNGTCWWLWRGAAISHDGGVSPCCYNNNKKYDFGNILKDDFKKIWNNENYLLARSLFSRKDMVKDDRKIICHGCKIIPKRSEN